MDSNLTRGFASPPHDGFAFSRKEAGLFGCRCTVKIDAARRSQDRCHRLRARERGPSRFDSLAHSWSCDRLSPAAHLRNGRTAGGRRARWPSCTVILARWLPGWPGLTMRRHAVHWPQNWEIFTTGPWTELTFRLEGGGRMAIGSARRARIPMRSDRGSRPAAP